MSVPNIPHTRGSLRENLPEKRQEKLSKKDRELRNLISNAFLDKEDSGITSNDKKVLNWMAMALKISDLKGIHAVGSRVSKKLYNTLSRNKQCQKDERRIFVSEAFKKKTGIGALSVVSIDRRKFSDAEQINKVFLRIKFKNKTEYFELAETDFNKIFPEMEYKRLRDTASALGDSYWAHEWRQKEVQDTYNRLDKQIINQVHQLSLSSGNKKLAIVEIAGGKGNLAEKIFNTLEESPTYHLLEYNHSSCLSARQRLESFGDQAKVIEGNALTHDFHELATSPPDVIIASGALTTQVFNNPEECRCVLKKMIEILPVGGKLILTGLQTQHISLANIQKLYPFKVLQTQDQGGKEFLVLEKAPVRTDKPIVQKDGSLDLFCTVSQGKGRLRDVLQSLSPEERSKVKRLDLSCCPLNPDEAKALELLPNLQSLACAYVKGADDFLRQVPKSTLAKLHSLDLSYTDVTRETLSKALEAAAPLHELRIDLCEKISIGAQLDFLVDIANKAKKIDLTFLNNHYYREYASSAILRFRDEWPAEEISIPQTLFLQLESQAQEKLRQFASGRHIEIVIDQPYHSDDRADEQNSITQILDRLKAVLPKTQKKPMLGTSSLSADEKVLYEKLKKLNLGIPSDKLSALIHFIHENGKGLRKKALGMGEVLHLDKKEYPFGRSINVFPNQKIYVDLKSWRLPIIGRGASKTVRYSLEFPASPQDEETLVASCTLDYKAARTLSMMQEKLGRSEIPGIVPILEASSYTKRGIEKFHIIVPYYPLGSLDQFIKQTRFQGFEEKAAKRLLSGVCAFHKQGLVHRDIHMGNIFIAKDESASLGDFDLVAPISDALAAGQINLSIAPPELLQAKLAVERNVRLEGLKNAFGLSEKIDVWQMGILMASLYGIKIDFIDRISQLIKTEKFNSMTDEMKYKKTLGIIQKYPMNEPKEKDSLEHLVWEMMRPEPEKRISIQEAIDQFNQIAPHTKTLVTSGIIVLPSYAGIWRG
jgi:serine/threonine protein kinase